MKYSDMIVIPRSVIEGCMNSVWLLSKSKPLEPFIEDAFEAGVERGMEQAGFGTNSVTKGQYLSKEL